MAGCNGMSLDGGLATSSSDGRDGGGGGGQGGMRGGEDEDGGSRGGMRLERRFSSIRGSVEDYVKSPNGVNGGGDHQIQPQLPARGISLGDVRSTRSYHCRLCKQV